MKGRKSLKKVKSVCPKCLEIIDAEVVIKKNKVYLIKHCKKHGKFESEHLWGDPIVYEKMEKIFKNESLNPNGIILYLTLDCNLGCPFCFSSEHEKDKSMYKNFKEPSVDEIIQRVKTLKEKIRFSTIFLFGGEPTLREDLFEIIKQIKMLGLEVCLMTNGLKLADYDYVKGLKNSGLDQILFQLDTLDKNKNEILRGRDVLGKKLKALSNLKEVNITTDIFSLIIKDFNEEDVKKLGLIAANNSDVIKIVYFSTITYEGKGRKSEFKQLTNSDRLKLIEKQLNITKNDFMECTIFDYHFSKFIKKLTGTECKHLSSCDIVCYLYSLGEDNFICLNKIINLKELSNLLEQCTKTLEIDSYIKYLKITSKSLNALFNKKIIMRWKFFPNLAKSLLLSLIPLSRNFSPKNNSKNIFRFIVTQFQDRFNLDMDTFRNCDLLTELPNGEVVTFCQKNILERN